MFSNCYPKYKARPSYEQDLQYWITKYEDIKNDERVAQYIGNLSINTQNDNKPGLNHFILSQSNFTPFLASEKAWNQ